MLKIAICDDERYCRKYIHDALINYEKEAGAIYEIDHFHSGEELLKLGMDVMKYKIIFLNINMNKLDGIETAKYIREISKDIFIVFVTAYINYTLEGYKVDAVRYLLKDHSNFQNTLSECMDAIAEKMDYKIVQRTFEFNEGIKKISLERLLYIESNLHKLEFHVIEDGVRIYTMYGVLSKLDHELENNGFIRIHQSYLVNLRYIKSVTRYKAKLMNGTELTIPKARYSIVKNKFISYKGEV